MRSVGAAKLFEIRNATVYRGRTAVFDRFSLALDLGQSAAVLGPNGSGKTTLLKLLCRELYAVASPDSSVRVLGRERWYVEELRSQLGLVSYDLQLRYQRDTRGLDVVLSGYHGSIGTYSHQRYSSEQRARAEAVLAELGAAHLRDQPFESLSTGEQRRLLLARALVHDPHTLLLDEPLTSLDMKAAFELLELLRRLLRAGRTLVLVTHRVEEIPPEIDRVVLLRRGKVFRDGEKSQVLTSENLGTLYETPVSVACAGGFYQAVPG